MFRWIIAIIFLLFVYHVREVFPPFIMGAITAYILYPAVKGLSQKSGMPPFLAVLCIYLLAVSFTVIVAFHFWPIIIDQSHSLFLQRREIVSNLVSQVAQQFNLSMDVDQMTALILGQVQNAIGRPEDIMHFGGLISKGLLGMLICAVTSVYMLVDAKRVGRFFMRFIPIEKRNTVVSLLSQMDIIFRKYIWGQIGLISLMSVIAFIIYTTFHLKYALLIALVTGFLEIIPVLGPMLAILICTTFAVAQLGLSNAMGVPLCLWIARLIEDYVVVPNTIGHAVELHPLAVIFSVVVGETMAGALGMLIAIPVAASVKVIIDFCYPAASTPPHHAVKNHSLDWLTKLFKPQPKHNEETPQEQAQEEREDRAKQDMAIINSMYEVGAEGHKKHSDRVVEHTSDKTTAELIGAAPATTTAETVKDKHAPAHVEKQTNTPSTTAQTPDRKEAETTTSESAPKTATSAPQEANPSPASPAATETAKKASEAKSGNGTKKQEKPSKAEPTQ